jgi:hypothetical protein
MRLFQHLEKLRHQAEQEKDEKKREELYQKILTLRKQNKLVDDPNIDEWEDI